MSALFQASMYANPLDPGCKLPEPQSAKQPQSRCQTNPSGSQDLNETLQRIMKPGRVNPKTCMFLWFETFSSKLRKLLLQWRFLSVTVLRTRRDAREAKAAPKTIGLREPGNPQRPGDVKTLMIMIYIYIYVCIYIYIYNNNNNDNNDNNNNNSMIIIMIAVH